MAKISFQEACNNVLGNLLSTSYLREHGVESGELLSIENSAKEELMDLAASNPEGWLDYVVGFAADGRDDALPILNEVSDTVKKSS